MLRKIIMLTCNETTKNNNTMYYNVTLRGVSVTIIVVEKTESVKYYKCYLICSACKAHAPYHTVICCPLSLLCFSHSFINSTIFGKYYWTKNVCSDFLYKSVSKLSHFKKNKARYYRKITNVLM